MSRLSAVPREALPESERRFYDAVRAIRRRPVSGPFIVTMNSSPDLAARIAHLGHYFHARGQADESIIPIRVRAFISLIGSRALDAPYEWGAWINWALEAGVPQETVDAIREGRSPPNLNAEEELVADLCRQLVTGNHRLREATFKAALERYGNQGLVELVMTLAYFAMIALPLNAFEIEMSAEQKGLRKPFAPLEVGGTPATDCEESLSTRALASANTAAPRVPLLATHEAVAPEHQHFLDRIVRTRGWLSPVFQVLLHTPDVAERVANVGAFLLYESGLEPRTQALVGLIAARGLDCDYVWSAWAGETGKTAVGAELIESLRTGKRAAPLSERDRILLAFCRQLLRANHHVSDVAYEAALSQFGVAATVRIAVLLGYCAMMSLVANAFEAGLPAEERRPAL